MCLYYAQHFLHSYFTLWLSSARANAEPVHLKFEGHSTNREPSHTHFSARARCAQLELEARGGYVWLASRPEAIMLLILPIILFCISHYISPIILSFFPIILKLFSTENSENTYIWDSSSSMRILYQSAHILSLNYRYKYLPPVLGSDSRSL